MKKFTIWMIPAVLFSVGTLSANEHDHSKAIHKLRRASSFMGKVKKTSAMNEDQKKEEGYQDRIRPNHPSNSKVAELVEKQMENSHRHIEAAEKRLHTARGKVAMDHVKVFIEGERPSPEKQKSMKQHRYEVISAERDVEVEKESQKANIRNHSLLTTGELPKK